MKIVQIVPYFLPARQFGGPVTVVHHLARGLTERGHDVSIVTLDQGIDASIPRNQWTEFEGLQVWYQKTKWWHRQVPYFVPDLARIYHNVMEWADVVHCHTAFTHMNFLALARAKEFRIPSIYTPHGNFCPTRLRQKWLPKKLFLSLFEQHSLKRATCLQALTRQESLDIQAQLSECKERIHIIPNGIFDTDFSTAQNRLEIRRSMNIPADAVVLLYLGQLVQFKGLDVTIPAYREIAQANDRVRLIIAGPDRGFEKQARLLAGNLVDHGKIQFVGLADHQKKKELQAASDGFVLTSHTEGLPMAILEALAAGLPALISQHCHVPEVQEFEAGCVFENDHASVVNAMRTFFDDAESRNQMQTNAVSLAIEKFRQQDVVEAMLQLYDAAIQANQNLPA